jgi:hypothetical protein
MESSLPVRPQITKIADLDGWVRHLVEIHFHPEHGTPYWIERARQLGIDARRDIRGYDDLALLGFLQIEDLRTRSVLDFLPAAAAKDRGKVRVHETGGTTGSPSRVPVRDFYDPVNRYLTWYLDEVVGFPKSGNWLFIGPTGPHGMGDSTTGMASLRDGICFLIDLDPRFIKVLLKQGDMRTIGLYMEHIRRQAYAILETQDISILGSTPAILQSMAPDLKERGYRFKGVMYGGTQLTRDLFHLLRTEFFPTAAQTCMYGNTLMGGAVMAPPELNDNEIVYHAMEPLVKIDVVDPEHPDQLVGMKQTGRVRLTVLSEERFLPRILERDLAERWPVNPVFGCEGVANVRSLATQQGPMSEGVY